MKVCDDLQEQLFEHVPSKRRDASSSQWGENPAWAGVERLSYASPDREDARGARARNFAEA